MRMASSCSRVILGIRPESLNFLSSARGANQEVHVSSTPYAATNGRIDDENILRRAHDCKRLPVVYHSAYSAPKLSPAIAVVEAQEKFRIMHELLLSEGTVSPEQVFCPSNVASDRELCQVHTRSYVESFSTGALDEKAVRRIGFGSAARTPVLVERTKAEVAGTLLTARIALRTGLACNLGGGTHHAFPDYGSGFCILNDLAVTAQNLLNAGLASRVLIVDLDVHQGDGTAAIFCSDARVFTLSVHGKSNFPARKQKSDLDIGLEDGTCDSAYLKIVANALAEVLDDFRPDIVLYDAGVDPHEEDPLGRLSLTDSGLLRRDLLVIDCCLVRGIPVAGCIGGGYDNDVQKLALRHCIVVRAATQMWKDYSL